VLPKFRRLIVAAFLLALGGAAPAAADTVESSNWAGYAIHRSGASFTKVAGAWRQPLARCTRGRRTYSALWVGLGGYSESSTALEQVGTEVDCTASGRVRSSAWFELVPQASRAIHLAVRPGDSIVASVTVSGDEVRVALWDRTTNHSFTKTLRTSTIDLSSAEWIVEAPSECFGVSNCRILPLANFGSATFSTAAAESAVGHVGTIADGDWDATKIRLSPGGRRFVLYERAGATAGAASPSPLRAGGSSFSVRYSAVTAARAAADAAALLAGRIYH
jgi:hypothetical protein